MREKKGREGAGDNCCIKISNLNERSFRSSDPGLFEHALPLNDLTTIFETITCSYWN